MSEVPFNNFDVKRINDCISQLRPHFDTVDIFCTRMSDDGTVTQTMNFGHGNWYARYGHLKSHIHDVEMGYITFKQDKPQGEIL